MNIQPYLFFDGRCEEAIAFYGEALDAKPVVLMRYADGPQPAVGPDGSSLPLDKVMHAMLQIGEAQIMLSDGMAKGQPQFQGVSLFLSVADDAKARKCFDALAAGGQVTMPIGPAFFASSFGMVTDRFGVAWMVAAYLPAAG